MTWERVTNELQRAHAMWQLDEAHCADHPSEPVISLSRVRAEEIVTQARQLLAADQVPAPSSGKRDSALIVTKAPHTGSDRTVAAIIARCLAFGLAIERV